MWKWFQRNWRLLQLRFALQDRDHDRIRRVAQGLGLIGENCAAADLLLPFLAPGHPSTPHTQCVIAEALGHLGNRSGIDFLIAALERSDSFGADNALKSLGEPAVQPLVDAIQHPKAIVTKRAIRILESLQWRPPLSMSPLTIAIAKGDVDGCVRWGKSVWGNNADIELTKELMSADYSKRRVAVEALLRLRSPSAVPELIATLMGEFDDWPIDRDVVYEWPTDALKQLVPFSIDPCVKVLWHPKPSVRKAAAAVLKSAGWRPSDLLSRIRLAIVEGRSDICATEGTAAVGPLIPFLQDTEPRTRRIAAEALGMSGDSRAVDPLVRALQDPEGQVRQTAATALGLTADSRAVEPLITLWQDELYANVRDSVIDALKRIGGDRAKVVVGLAHSLKVGCFRSCVFAGELAVKPLINLVSGSRVSGHEYSDAAWALAQIGNARAIEALESAISKEDGSNGRLAVEALGQSKHPDALFPLVRALGYRRSEVVVAAAQQLGRRADIRAVEPLIDRLGVGFNPLATDDDQRLAIAEALGQIGDPRAIEPLKNLVLSIQDFRTRGFITHPVSATRLLETAQKAASTLEKLLPKQNS